MQDRSLWLVMISFAAVPFTVCNALAHDITAGQYPAANSGSNTTQANPWDMLNFALGASNAYALSNYVKIYVSGDYRFIESDGIPSHPTGEFPNPGNPNTISEQSYRFRVPVRGSLNNETTPLGHSPFGVAINGVPFDPGTAEFWNGDPRWCYEAMYLGSRLGLDQNNAHVQPNGAYHYHGIPTGLMESLRKAGQPTLIGYAADGFPVYGPYGYKISNDPKSQLKKLKSSYRLKSGTRPNGPGGYYDGAFAQDYEFVRGLGDLDDCNGRLGTTSEYPTGTYYYVITDSYPYIPRGFKGTPDISFKRRVPGGGPPGFGPPGFGPPGGPPRFGPREFPPEFRSPEFDPNNGGP
jgi:hypothetical protein